MLLQFLTQSETTEITKTRVYIEVTYSFAQYHTEMPNQGTTVECDNGVK